MKNCRAPEEERLSDFLKNRDPKLIHMLPISMTVLIWFKAGEHKQIQDFAITRHGITNPFLSSELSSCVRELSLHVSLHMLGKHFTESR